MKKTMNLLFMVSAMFFLLLTSVYASDFAYTVDSITLADTRGEAFSNEDGICVVTAEISKIRETEGNERVWFAGYSEDGRLLNVEYTDISVAAGETGYEVVELISSPDKIDRVSVFIWKNDSSLTPLAESVTKESEKKYVYCDSSLFYSISMSDICFRKNAGTNNTDTYKISSLGAQLYVNGVYYSDVQRDISRAEDVISSAEGDIKLILDDRGYVTAIEAEVYIYARINQYTYSGGVHRIILYSFMSPDSNLISQSTAGFVIEIYDADIEDGEKQAEVIRNGKKSSLELLKGNDVLAVRYDINTSISNSDSIKILATDEEATAQYLGYDEAAGVYNMKDSVLGVTKDYKVTCNNDISDYLENGSKYALSLDPMGRIFDFNIVEEAKNLVIVERYVDVNRVATSSEYSYIEVMTLGGEKKLLYIEPDSESDSRYIMDEMGICTTVAATAESVPIEDRIIEYRVKPSTGRIREINIYTDAEVRPAVYNKTLNKLGKYLSENAVILDATAYMKGVNSPSGKPRIEDYRVSSLEELVDEAEYDCILVGKNNSDEYSNVIIKTAEDMNIKYEEKVETDKISSISEEDITYRLDTYSEYAIVERYVDVEAGNTSAEYSYIEVMTLSGEVKSLNIHMAYDNQARTIFDEMGIRATVAATANKVPIEKRIIKYNINAEGFIMDISVDNGALKLVKSEYNESGFAGNISADCTVIDATVYMDAVEDAASKPSTRDYTASGIGRLTENGEYDVILVNNQGDGYEYAIVTEGSLSDSITPPADKTEYVYDTCTLDNAKLYINGSYYIDIKEENIAKIENILKYSNGKLILKGSTEGLYSEVYAECSAVATVEAVENNGDEFTIKISELISSPENFDTITLYGKEIRNKSKTLTVTRNGQSSTFMDIKPKDIITVKYDFVTGIGRSAFIDIAASDRLIRAYLLGCENGICTIRDINSFTTDSYIIKEENIPASGGIYDLYMKTTP